MESDDAYKVTIPEFDTEGVCVERFTIPQGFDITNMRYALYGRDAMPGTYTRLIVDNTLWMSDTTAEWRDHGAAVRMIRRESCRGVLINGLGLGLVVQAALRCAHVQHIDVVEYDERIIRLIGPHYADPRLHIHHDDAYTIKWPTGTRWNVAWHDIWPSLNEDNIAGMTKLHRRYGRRSDWQGSWGEDFVKRMRDRWQSFAF